MTRDEMLRASIQQAQNAWGLQARPATVEDYWEARLAEQDARNPERARHWRRQWQILSRMGVVE